MHKNNSSQVGLRQRGSFMLGMAIALLAASVVTVGSARLAINNFKENIGKSLGSQVQTVVTALDAYNKANSTALTANTSITGVANIYAPTISELKALGYLNAAVQTTPTAGNAYKISVSLSPSGCTTACTPVGAVYLQEPIYGPDSKVADIRLLGAAMAASTSNQIGFSNPESKSLITGAGWIFTNPDASQRAGILYGTTSLSGASASGSGTNTLYWLQSKETFASLPSTGNTLGDGRLTQDTRKPYIWNGTKWVDLYTNNYDAISIGKNSGDAFMWGLFIGTNAGSNNSGVANVFIGEEAGGYSNYGSSNVFLGYQSGFSHTEGSGNTFLGHRSGQKHTTGLSNTYIGASSGPQYTSATGTGSYNLFAGICSGCNNQSGTGNVFLGHQSGMRNTSGTSNVFAGRNSGSFNTSGQDNSFIGSYSGFYNTSGSWNVFNGTQTGFYNSTGESNTFTGFQSGFSNSSGSNNAYYGAYAGHKGSSATGNSFFGKSSGLMNNGSDNAFFGSNSGSSNVNGTRNSFFGANSGPQNNGSNNVFVGYYAGLNNNTGSNNTLLGFLAGEKIQSGSFNTLIRNGSDLGDSSLTNASAFGFGAIASISNSVRIGNSSVSLIGGAVGWSNLSDRRLKTEIYKSERGLNFINKITPVDYKLIDNKRSETGFIAQDVEAIDPSFPGVNKPANDKDFYSLTYTDFIPSIVKSIQELDTKITDLAIVSGAPKTAEFRTLKKVVIFMAFALFAMFGLVIWLSREVITMKKTLSKQLQVV